MMRFSWLDLPRLVLIVLTVVTMLAGGVVMSSSSSGFGAYNPTWEGTSSFRQEATETGAEPVIATNTTEYNRVDPNESVAIILSPERRYSGTDVARVQRFVRNGGMLVVAEDFGEHTNPLLSILNARARVDGRLLRDEQQYYRSPAFVVASDVTLHTLTGSTEQLTLNHGTAVEPNGARVLINSSSLSYLDTDRSGSPDGDEELDSYPVVTVEPIGQGSVVVVSDPSVFINAMQERPGNRQFARTLLAGHQTVVLDYSHGGKVPPLPAATMTVQRSPFLRGLVGVIGVAAVALAKRRYG